MRRGDCRAGCRVMCREPDQAVPKTSPSTELCRGPVFAENKIKPKWFSPRTWCRERWVFAENTAEEVSRVSGIAAEESCRELEVAAEESCRELEVAAEESCRVPEKCRELVFAENLIKAKWFSPSTSAEYLVFGPKSGFSDLERRTTTKTPFFFVFIPKTLRFCHKNEDLEDKTDPNALRMYKIDIKRLWYQL